MEIVFLSSNFRFKGTSGRYPNYSINLLWKNSVQTFHKKPSNNVQKHCFRVIFMMGGYFFHITSLSHFSVNVEMHHSSAKTFVKLIESVIFNSFQVNSKNTETMPAYVVFSIKSLRIKLYLVLSHTY